MSATDVHDSFKRTEGIGLEKCGDAHFADAGHGVVEHSGFFSILRFGGPVEERNSVHCIESRFSRLHAGAEFAIQSQVEWIRDPRGG